MASTNSTASVSRIADAPERGASMFRHSAATVRLGLRVAGAPDRTAVEGPGFDCAQVPGIGYAGASPEFWTLLLCLAVDLAQLFGNAKEHGDTLEEDTPVDECDQSDDRRHDNLK
jgi:hypothetical protein